MGGDGDVYVLHFRVDEDDTCCKSDATEGKDGVVFCEQRLAVKPKHAEVYDHCLGGRHEHPPEVDFEVEPAVALAFSIQLWHSKQRAGGQIFLKDAHENNGERGEERVEGGEGPGFVEGGACIAYGALVEGLC